MPAEDLTELVADDEEGSVTCEFCNATYAFATAEITVLRTA